MSSEECHSNVFSYKYCKKERFPCIPHLCLAVHFYSFSCTLKVREYQQLSQGSQSSNRAISGDRSLAITALAEDVGGGNVQVGKITFNTNEILGNGCEGTFVFK